jgi:hypothetical protein
MQVKAVFCTELDFSARQSVVEQRNDVGASVAEVAGAAPFKLA